MGSVGDCHDNATAESFFATLECELLDRSRFKTHSDARNAIFDFVQGFYNPRHRHSSLGYVSPMTFERQDLASAACPGPSWPSPRGRTKCAAFHRPSARQRVECAGRDGRMGVPQAEQNYVANRQEKPEGRRKMAYEIVA